MPSVLVTFSWRLMSHFHSICHYDYIINIVINLVIFLKEAMQSGDNRMTVASFPTKALLS